MSDLYKYAWLKDLFDQDPLYAVTPPSSSKEVQDADGSEVVEGVPYEGSYTNEVLIVHSLPADGVAQSPEFALLQKILKAVSCNIEETALCSIQELPESIKAAEVLANLEPKQALFFLSQPHGEQLRIDLPRYTVETGLGQGAIILSDTLTQLMGDEGLKRQLWMALKQAFKH